MSCLIAFEVSNGSVYAQSDVNRDGRVNIQDLVLVANAIGDTVAADTEKNTDVNTDATIDILDLVQVASNLTGVSAAPTLNGTTAEEIQTWLTEVRHADDGSPAFRRAIAILEVLLQAHRPGTTVLLSNYPNPFNPETWIPYQLAKPTNVTLTIYAVDGRLIRTLTLGHQPAGMYQSKSRTAYWDGKNEVGEQVAIGDQLVSISMRSLRAISPLPAKC